MHVCAVGSVDAFRREFGVSYAGGSVGTCMCVQLKVWMHPGESLEHLYVCAIGSVDACRRECGIMQEGVLVHACVCNWKCGCMQEGVWRYAGGSVGTCMTLCVDRR